MPICSDRLGLLVGDAMLGVIADHRDHSDADVTYTGYRGALEVVPTRSSFESVWGYVH